MFGAQVRSVLLVRLAVTILTFWGEAGALATVESIRSEYENRAHGAEHEMTALGQKVKFNNGHVFGHGLSAKEDAQGSLITFEDLAAINGKRRNGKSHGSVMNP